MHNEPILIEASILWTVPARRFIGWRGLHLSSNIADGPSRGSAEEALMLVGATVFESFDHHDDLTRFLLSRKRRGIEVMRSSSRGRVPRIHGGPFVAVGLACT